MTTPAAKRTLTRRWMNKASSLLAAQERLEEDILVAVHEMKEDGLPNSTIAGWFHWAPTSVPDKARKGQQILDNRKRGSKG